MHMRSLTRSQSVPATASMRRFRAADSEECGMPDQITGGVPGRIHGVRTRCSSKPAHHASGCNTTTIKPGKHRLRVDKELADVRVNLAAGYSV